MNHSPPLAPQPVDHLAMQAAALTEGAVPTRILVMPWGQVKSTAGEFIVDRQAADAVLSAFAEHGTDVPIDYEHQTLGGPYSSPTGLAPAAGWIKALRAVSPDDADDSEQPGIWADVEWTDEAHERLRGKQYRYLSPVALVRRDDRRVVGLHSIALTNKPAIVGMKPVVNADAIDPESALEDLRGLLLLDESASDDLLIVAAAQRIRTMQRAESLRLAAQRVDRAAAAGKLSTAQREWALALAERDPDEFDRWEAAAPRLVPLGRSAAPTTDRDHSRRASEQSARAEYRANQPLLGRLCTEDAFVAAAVRDARN